jgi:hypothetical protein
VTRAVEVLVHCRVGVDLQDWPVTIDGVEQPGSKVIAVSMPVRELPVPRADGSTYEPTGENTATVMVRGYGRIERVPIVNG